MHWRSGSKSISNRALILAALCETEVKLQGMLESEDASLMKEALISLGVSVQSGQDSSTLTVRGCGGRSVKNQRIEVGNAGTVARFLTALLALQKDGTYHLDGSDAMRVRPMKELLTALEKGVADSNSRVRKVAFPSPCGPGDFHKAISKWMRPKAAKCFPPS